MPAAKRNDVVRTCEECGEKFRCAGHARYCPVCRPGMRRPKRTKYKITEAVKQLLKDRYDSRVRGRAGELARELGWPRWAVTKAGQKLGLATPWPKDRRDWTDEEEAFVRQWAGRRSTGWMALRLDRGETAVVNKIKRLRLTRRLTEGYTIRALEECLGVDHRKINEWIDKGWLRREWASHNGERGKSQIPEEDVLALLREHQDEYQLKHVDQNWFLWMVFDSTSARAAADEQVLKHAVPDPSPATIARRAMDIRRMKGEVPESTGR